VQITQYGVGAQISVTQGYGAPNTGSGVIVIKQFK
jgi:hypothetical protein